MTNHCAGCPLEVNADPLSSRGPAKAKYLIVTDTPSEANARHNRLLSKASMALLGSSLTAAGFSKDDFAFAPAIRCAHDTDTFTTAQKRDIAGHCRGYLLEDIAKLRPEAVLPLGAEAAKQVFGRAVKITKVRGQATYEAEMRAQVFPLINPAQCVMYPQHEPILRADCMSFGRMVYHHFDATAASGALLGDYEIIDDLQFLIDLQAPVLAFDTETTGLRWFQGGADVREFDPKVHGADYQPAAAILTMQFCVRPGKAYLLVWDHPEAPKSYRAKARLRTQLRLLMNNPRTMVVGQNAKFDRGFMRNLEDVDFPISGDTLMLGVLLDENAMEKNQDILVKRYVPERAGYADQFNSTIDKSRMWEVPLNKLLDYAAGDAETCFMLHEALYPLVAKDKKLLGHYNRVSIPGNNVFSLIESAGLGVDFEALNSFQAHMTEHVASLKAQLLQQVPRSIKRKHIDKGLSFGRKDFLLDILFWHPDGFRLSPKVFTKTTAKLSPEMRVPSTSSKDHLPYFFDMCPFTITLAEYIKDERLLGTSILKFREKYIVDGMIRPTYSLAKAVTGRSSSYDPNGQNYPKRGVNATAYRRMMVPPPGYVVLEADLSQAELRIAAEMANEPTMLRIYRSGGDIHIETALIILGTTLTQFKLLPKAEQKLARQKAKAVNFGLLYGMWWRKLIIYAKTQYQVEFSEDEARNIREAFFQKYSALGPWHEDAKAFARKHKYIRSLDGRIRHLPMVDSGEEYIRQEAERQAVNSPVQGFASDLGIMAMARLARDVDPAFLLPVAFVHDAIYCFVLEKYAEWGAKTLKWYMESNPLEEWFGLKMKVPILADVSVGRNLGDMYELEGIDIDRRYDFSQLWDEEEQKGIRIARQSLPLHNGRRAVPEPIFPVDRVVARMVEVGVN